MKDAKFQGLFWPGQFELLTLKSENSIIQVWEDLLFIMSHLLQSCLNQLIVFYYILGINPKLLSE